MSQLFIFDVTQQSLEQGLRGAGLRGTALAQNIANINTANYRRVDVPFQAALSDAVRQANATGSSDLNPDFHEVTDDLSPVRADGNNVDTDQENTFVAENGLLTQGLSSVLGMRRRQLETIMRTTGV